MEYETLYIPDLIAIAIANYYLNDMTEQQQTSNNYHKYRKNTPNYNTWIAQSAFSFNRSSVNIYTPPSSCPPLGGGDYFLAQRSTLIGSDPWGDLY